MQPLEVLPNDFPLALFFPANTGEVWGIECSHLIFSGSGVLCLTALFALCKIQGKVWEQHLWAVQEDAQVGTGLRSPQPCRGANKKPEKLETVPTFLLEALINKRNVPRMQSPKTCHTPGPPSVTLISAFSQPSLQPFPPVSSGFCPFPTVPSFPASPRHV